MFRKLSWILAAGLVVIAGTMYQHQEVEIARLARDKAAIQAQANDRRAAAFVRGPTRYPGSIDEHAPLPAQPPPPVLGHDGSDDDRPVDAERASAARWEEEVRASEAAVEDGFAAEAVDPAWAAGAATEIRTRLGAIVTPPSSSLGNAECHSSMCRVEMVARDGEAMKRFMDRGFGAGGGAVWNEAMMAEYQPPEPDGTTRVILYLGRKGTSFPRPAS